jgi:hypothetical protein
MDSVFGKKFGKNSSNHNPSEPAPKQSSFAPLRGEN